MKYLLTLLLLALSLQATEPIKVYSEYKFKANMKVWCFEGTKWLWTGSHHSAPVQIMATKNLSYEETPKPIPCKEN